MFGQAYFGAGYFGGYLEIIGAYTLVCDAGSYTITGAAASTLAQRYIGAAAGSYAITGSATTLNHGYYISAAAGSYVITGSPLTATVVRIAHQSLIGTQGITLSIVGTKVASSSITGTY